MASASSISTHRPPPPAHPRTSPDEVHVWHVALSDVDAESAQAVLSIDERRRAERFRFPRDRDRFVKSRGSLRNILAAYCEEPPEHLPLVVDPFGKPFLDRPSRDLRFNLSHSGRHCLIAVTEGHEVGVDVEQLRPDFEWADVAARCFTPGEKDFVLAHPPDQRLRAFFTSWTFKEAWLKAAGTGLSSPMDRFEVSPSLQSPEPIRLSASVQAWSLEPAADATGAVVVLGSNPNLRLRHWSAPVVLTAPAVKKQQENREF